MAVGGVTDEIPATGVPEEGSGWSAEQFSDFVNESGLAEELEADAQDDSPDAEAVLIAAQRKARAAEHHADEDAEEPQAHAREERRPEAAEAVQPHTQHQAQPQLPQQPQGAPSLEQAAADYQRLGQMHSETQAQLAAVRANRAALQEAHGKAEVAAYETSLQAKLSVLEQQGQQVQRYAERTQREQHQAALQNAQRHVTDLGNQMRREFQLSPDELNTLTDEAVEHAIEQGSTKEEFIQAIWNGGPPAARAVLREAIARRETARRSAEHQRELRQMKRRLADAQRSGDPAPRHSYGETWYPGGGSLAEAATAFEKLGIT